MSKLENFNFETIEITEAVMIENVPFFTRRAIGEWLEYTDPKDGIYRCIERNPEVENHSVVVNLSTTDGKKYDTRVYHPIGFLLIVMASDQPKAKAMKEQVARFVWEYGRVKFTVKEQLQLGNQRINLLAKLETCKNAFVRESLYQQLVTVSQAMNQALPDKLLLNNPEPKQLPMPV